MKNKIYKLIILSFLFNQSVWAQTWSSVGFGISALNPNSNISAIAVDSTGNLYAAGSFTDSTYWNQGYPYVAKWNGTNWSELGTGSNKLKPNCPIRAIAADKQGNIYAAGQFTDSLPVLNGGHYYVAKWDGSHWSKLGTGSQAINANGSISHLTIDNIGNVYAIGGFTDSTIGGQGHKYVAKWNGTTWSALGVGTNALLANGSINTIATDKNGNVYVAGTFTDSAVLSKGHPYIAKWDGSHWNNIGGSFSAGFSGLTFDKWGNLYASGGITDSGKIGNKLHGSYCVAKWDGTSWSLLGIGNNVLTIHSVPAGIGVCQIDKFGRIYVATSALDTAHWGNSNNIYEYQWATNSWSFSFYANGGLYGGISKSQDGSTLYTGGAFTDSVSPYKGHSYVAQYTVATEGNMPTGMNSLNAKEEKMLVYPNPTSNELSVVSYQFAIKTIEVHNVLGQKMQVAITPLNTYDLRLNTYDYPSGIYFIKATDAQGNISNAKFLKE